MGKGTMEGVRNVIGACNEALDANPGRTVLLIETMAGQNHSVGSRFEELRLILDGVKESERMGVCLDTCHVFAAGFDLSSKPAVERTMGMFEDIVGKERLKVVHLNDSKGPVGSGLDRHEYVGKGQIGEKGFRAFLHYGDVAELPIIMEVPGGREDAVRGEPEDGKAPHGRLAPRGSRSSGRGPRRPACRAARSSSTGRPRRTSSGGTLSRASPSRAPRSRTTPCRPSGRCSSSSRC